VEEAGTEDTKWAALRSLLFVLFNLREASKCLLIALVVIAVAGFAAWVIGQMKQAEVHYVNLTSGPVVLANGSGATEQVLRICVDSGATSGCISSARVNLVKVTNANPLAKKGESCKWINFACNCGWRFNLDQFEWLRA